ncbi:MAG: hypothetical protein V3T31_01875, partial [candidate division Zixibacteria bacterium]
MRNITFVACGLILLCALVTGLWAESSERVSSTDYQIGGTRKLAAELIGGNGQASVSPVSAPLLHVHEGGNYGLCEHGVQLDNMITLENLSEEAITYTLTFERDNGPLGWLSGPTSSEFIPAGSGNTVAWTLSLNVSGIINSPGTIESFTGRVIVTSNSISSPDTIAVEMTVADSYPLGVGNRLYIADHIIEGAQGLVKLGLTNTDPLASLVIPLFLCDSSAITYVDSIRFSGRLNNSGVLEDRVLYSYPDGLGCDTVFVSAHTSGGGYLPPGDGEIATLHMSSTERGVVLVDVGPVGEIDALDWPGYQTVVVDTQLISIIALEDDPPVRSIDVLFPTDSSVFSGDSAFIWASFSRLPGDTMPDGLPMNL